MQYFLNVGRIYDFSYNIHYTFLTTVNIIHVRFLLYHYLLNVHCIVAIYLLIYYHYYIVWMFHINLLTLIWSNILVT